MPPKKTYRLEFSFLAPGQSRYPIIEFEEEMLIPQQQLDTDVDILPEDVLNRLNAEGKVATRDMGPYGQGLMASKVIQEGDLLIYGGIYITSAESPSRYFAQVDENLLIDSQHLKSSASLLQHLPISLPATCSDQDVATENMLLTMAYWCVRPGFYIPLAVLVAKRRIYPGEILGYSYDAGGLEYWSKLGITPALFKRNGGLFANNPCNQVYC